MTNNGNSSSQNANQGHPAETAFGLNLGSIHSAGLPTPASSQEQRNGPRPSSGRADSTQPRDSSQNTSAQSGSGSSGITAGSRSSGTRASNGNTAPLQSNNRGTDESGAVGQSSANGLPGASRADGAFMVTTGPMAGEPALGNQGEKAVKLPDIEPGRKSSILIPREYPIFTMVVRESVVGRMLWQSVTVSVECGYPPTALSRFVLQ